jgi:hypothetical protein
VIKAGGGALAANGVDQHSVTQVVTGIVTAIIGVVWSHWFHTDDPTPPTTGAKATLLFMLGCLGLMLGCAALQPGADPIVVRTEQAEQGAKATFDLVLNAEGGTSANRLFWMSNAPAFHNFCEDLRRPVMLGTNTYPKCIAAIISLESIKENYKSGRANSNDLITAEFILTGLLNQANAWYTIVTNNPH